MSEDKLIVQVALKIKLPPGKTVGKKVLQQILDIMMKGERLPRNVEIRGIFWRNPTRGKVSDWRYHEGADLRVAPQPIEPHPRGSLRSAIDTIFNERMPRENISFHLQTE